MNARVIEAKPVSTRHIPGELGLWIFVLGDMLVFGLFFSVFVFYRAQNPELFMQSQATLNSNYGALNTIFLLTSSWLVVLGINAARKNLNGLAFKLLLLAMLCGAGFISVKVIEYSEKIHAGIGLTTNDFYMFYFILTGLHFFHVLIGMVALAVLCVIARRGISKPSDLAILEGGASYWHMVDVLWIVLFPLLYLMK
ncbi:MAG: cytochrome c oxidase subunit [Verrucomicrobiaceae bacterium]|nr:cytochrome c oxidase subunit [Verrucomicrobiaceae bacterium]